MNERPEQPPEGKLIAAATERSGLSIREASRRAGISYGRWRQITSGVQHVSPGNLATVRAPAKTLAKMAAVVGITPEQLEGEGQRADAADAMRHQQDGRFAEPEPPRRDRALSVLADADEDGLLPYIEQVQADLDAAREDHGPLFGASQAFADPHEATIWHDPDNVLSRDERIRFIARMRRTIAELDERERRTGLAALPGRW